MSPNEAFRKGCAALARGNPVQAADHFQSAINLERERGAIRPQMRYQSYYGLSVALARRPTHETIEMCTTAAATDQFDPDLQLNLARICLLAGKTTRALAAIERGLRLDPDNRRLRRLLEKVDRRAEPLVRRLGRDHPLNRTAGRIRASLKR